MKINETYLMPSVDVHLLGTKGMVLELFFYDGYPQLSRMGKQLTKRDAIKMRSNFRKAIKSFLHVSNANDSLVNLQGKKSVSLAITNSAIMDLREFEPCNRYVIHLMTGCVINCSSDENNEWVVTFKKVK